ncbi:myozenin-2-like [Engraulis encrasicolus]|uniref:myozenin-2-like n=1 Tax=Engraulis encrasicolus TaxID=184585 RepID=UPI002FD29CEC
MLEELSLSSNRGSRLFKLRQQRAEKYTFDAIQQEKQNGLSVPLPPVPASGNHGDETSAEHDNTEAGDAADAVESEAPPERVAMPIIPSPWQQALGLDPAHSHTLLSELQPQPQLPSYKSFNRVALPFSGFGGVAPRLQYDEAPPTDAIITDDIDAADQSESLLSLRPSFNRTALGWVSHGNHGTLPTVALEILDPEMPRPLPDACEMMYPPESEEL